MGRGGSFRGATVSARQPGASSPLPSPPFGMEEREKKRAVPVRGAPYSSVYLRAHALTSDSLPNTRPGRRASSPSLPAAGGEGRGEEVRSLDCSLGSPTGCLLSPALSSIPNGGEGEEACRTRAWGSMLICLPPCSCAGLRLAIRPRACPRFMRLPRPPSSPILGWQKLFFC